MLVIRLLPVARPGGGAREWSVVSDFSQNPNLTAFSSDPVAPLTLNLHNFDQWPLSECLFVAALVSGDLIGVKHHQVSGTSFWYRYKMGMTINRTGPHLTAPGHKKCQLGYIKCQIDKNKALKRRR